MASTVAALAARRFLQPLHVTPLVLARALRRRERPPAAVIAVYRESNAPRLARLLAALPGADSALWALDRPSDLLRERTIGTGAGTRTELLNELERAVSPILRDGSYLIVTDDDVAMGRGQLELFVRACGAAGFDLAQPGHLPRSHASWPFVRQRLATFARITDFVEQGPLMAFSRRGLEQCFPLPESLGMGWGLEAAWATLSRAGLLRLGIVDAAGMRHLQPVSAAYERPGAESQARRVLREAGFSSFAEMQVTRAEWRLGQPRPDWVAG
jgi:hypothetical protein